MRPGGSIVRKEGIVRKEAFALPVPSGDGASLCASVRSLDVSFGGRRVLHGIDADFPASRITVLLGRSGSGKTTFLRALNRLNECFEGCESSGDVRVSLGGILMPTAGPNAPSISRLRRAAGMVFQTPNPLPMSIRRNVTLPVSLAGDLSRDRLEEILRERLQEVGLWEEVADRLDSPASTLSGGQQQRLCLARALALDPELLLLDEPTASLDRDAALRIEELILSFRGRRSVILVSHNLRQARRLADVALVLSGGRIVKRLDARELGASIDDGSLLDEAYGDADPADSTPSA